MESRTNRVERLGTTRVRKFAGKRFTRLGILSFSPQVMLEIEIEALQRMEGKNVPRLLEVGDNYFDMSYAGEPLSRNNVPLDWERQLRIIVKNLESCRIVHRDIKPSNICVLEGTINIIDFGCAWIKDRCWRLSPSELVWNKPRKLIYENEYALTTVFCNVLAQS